MSVNRRIAKNFMGNKNRRRQMAFQAAQKLISKNLNVPALAAPVQMDRMVVDEGLPVLPPLPPLPINLPPLPINAAGGLRIGGRSSAYRRDLAARKGGWHPLMRVKNAIKSYLPSAYWTSYPIRWNFGPGRSSGNGMATKINWKKLLGDAFSMNGLGYLKYTKNYAVPYQNQKRWKQAVGRRAGWRKRGPGGYG